ncbi:hypothetical protein HDU86_007846 [Geranomyces michiganensis]|nr:hypothetical protein HDU86_007846 [Geranomyces michiganensis]
MHSPAATANPARAALASSLDIHSYRTHGGEDDAEDLNSGPSSPTLPRGRRDFSGQLASAARPSSASITGVSGDDEDDDDEDLISQMSSLKVADDSRPPSSAFTRSAGTSVGASPTKGGHGAMRDVQVPISGRREVAQFSLLDPRLETGAVPPPPRSTEAPAPSESSRPDSPLMLMDEEEEDLFGIADSTFPDEELPPIAVDPLPTQNSYHGSHSDAQNDALAYALATPLPPSPAIVNSQSPSAQPQTYGKPFLTTGNQFDATDSVATPTRPSTSALPARPAPMQFSLDVTGLPPSGRATPAVRARADAHTPQTVVFQQLHTPRASPYPTESHSPLQKQQQDTQWLHGANALLAAATSPTPQPANATSSPAAGTFQFRAARSAPNLTSGRSPASGPRSTAGHTPRKAAPHPAGSGAGVKGQRTRPGTAKPVKKLPYNRDVTINVPFNEEPMPHSYATSPHATPTKSSISTSSPLLKSPSTTRLPTPSPLKEIRSHAKRELDAAAAAEGPGIAKFSRGPSKLPLAAGISRIPARIPRPAPVIPRAVGTTSSLSASLSSHSLMQQPLASSRLAAAAAISSAVPRRRVIR